MSKKRPIGVFDSGVGGLTVLKKLVKELPDEDYLYFGDTARVPYGEKTKEQLFQFVKEILDWYSSNDVKAVLMACNTSSAVVLDDVKGKYDFPVYGLIQPTANYAANLNIKKIGVIATSATIKSKAYENAILAVDKNKEIFETACPGLVELVEKDIIQTAEAKELVTSYIKPFIDNKIEKIILGCTHYPYLANVINQITNKPDMLIDPADYLVKAVKQDMDSLGLLNYASQGSRSYFVSSSPEKFVEVGSKFYNDCTSAKEISFNLIEIDSDRMPPYAS